MYGDTVEGLNPTIQEADFALLFKKWTGRRNQRDPTTFNALINFPLQIEHILFQRIVRSKQLN